MDDRLHIVTGTALPPLRRLAVDAKLAAEMLGICERLLWDLTRSGEIVHVRIGRRVLYPVAALEAFVAARTRRGTQTPPAGPVGGTPA